MFMLYSGRFYFVKPSKLMEENTGQSFELIWRIYRKISLTVFSNCCLFCSFRRQYQPLSLTRLQYLIDLGRVDPTQPIDLTQLVNGRGVTIQPLKRDYGVQLVEEVSLD